MQILHKLITRLWLHAGTASHNRSITTADGRDLGLTIKDYNKARPAENQCAGFERFCNAPFVNMDLKVLPHAIAWMAMDESGRSLLYQFVRNSSNIVDTGSGVESKDEPEYKRQRTSRCEY